MDLKAFQKIYAEAEDAIAERRFFDALSLTEAILKDTPYQDALEELPVARKEYSDLLQQMFEMNAEEREEHVCETFRNVIDLLQMSRAFWNLSHPLNSHSSLCAKLQEFDGQQALDQLYHTNKSQLGQETYQTALDAAFSLLWHLQIEPYIMPSMKMALTDASSFTRRTLVSAFLLGLLDKFTVEKLQLILALAEKNKKDTDEEYESLMAQVTIALVIVYQRYEPFFQFFTDEYKELCDFFAREDVKERLPLLLHAITSEGQTKLIGQRIDNIFPVIRDAFEKLQPSLGSHDDEDAKDDKKSEPFNIDIKEIKIDASTGDRLFKKLSQHAREIDSMRQSDLDVNQVTYIYMKRFPWFDHPAHWFYPFSTEIPDVWKWLTRPNGKFDFITQGIMLNSRFCTSDCYSFANMIGQLRERGRSQLTDYLNDSLSDDDNIISEMVVNDEERPTKLNPYADYCQTLERFFYHQRNLDYPYNPFTESHKLLLRLPLIKGTITNEDDLRPSIETLHYLGAYDMCVAYIEFNTELFGIGTDLLYIKGVALMQLQHWQQALSTFQQLLLIDEEYSGAELAMARCFEALSQWDQALPLLIKEEQRRGDENSTEVANLIEEIGRCLIQLQQWDEAVQRFFRLEFMNRHMNVARRAIAWCSIHQGKYERAATYYRQLLTQRKSTWEDMLNLGHALWLQDETAEAINSYRESVQKFNKAKEAQRRHFRYWSEAFQEDARNLLSTHFNENDCALMLDTILMPS